jgi:hypothetical protein
MQTLVIPPAAQRDEQSIQMISTWIAEKGLHSTLNVGMWHAQGKSEAGAWGIVLADLIRHIANAIREEHGTDTETTIRKIVEALHAELDEPTSKVEGGFHPGHT